MKQMMIILTILLIAACTNNNPVSSTQSAWNGTWHIDKAGLDGSPITEVIDNINVTGRTMAFFGYTYTCDSIMTETYFSGHRDTIQKQVKMGKPDYPVHVIYKLRIDRFTDSITGKVGFEIVDTGSGGYYVKNVYTFKGRRL
jgi:hypothetical protein